MSDEPLFISDLRHLIDAFIESGCAEDEDIPVLDRLDAYLNPQFHDGGNPYA